MAIGIAPVADRRVDPDLYFSPVLFLSREINIARCLHLRQALCPYRTCSTIYRTN
jgi:hypothetical protein